MEEFDEEELMGYLDAEEIFINSNWAWVPDDDDTPMSVDVTKAAVTCVRNR